MWLTLLLLSCAKPDDFDECVDPGFVDGDGDGFGDVAASCGDPLAVSDGGDCDDADAAVNPRATEDCATEADDNCDGSTNDPDALGCQTFYTDVDGDGFGSGAVSACVCVSEAPVTANNADDCDDSDAAVNPRAGEDCATEADDDCDGTSSEINAIGCTVYYADADGDGAGDDATGECQCAPTTGRIAEAGDCDDGDPGAYPGATEICDGAQNDCAGAWTADTEDGIVTRFYASGAFAEDLSATFATSTTVTLPADGTVNVCGGTYNVHLLAEDSTAVVVGLYGSSETFLTGGPTLGSMLAVKGGALVVSGVTFSGGGGELCSYYACGGGAYVTQDDADHAEPTLSCTDCSFANNNPTYGRAYYPGGGGLWLGGGARVVLTDSSVVDNYGYFGGGFALNDAAILELDGTRVDGNGAVYDGAGGYMASGSIVRCAGATGVDAGFTSNWTTYSSYNAAIYLGGGRLESDACDWGVGSTENGYGLGDVSGYLYGDDATFLCTSAGCL